MSRPLPYPDPEAFEHDARAALHAELMAMPPNWLAGELVELADELDMQFAFNACAEVFCRGDHHAAAAGLEPLIARYINQKWYARAEQMAERCYLDGDREEV